MFSLVGGVAPAAAVATRPAASATAKSARARPLHLMGFIAPPFEVSAVRVTTAGCFVLLFTVTSPSGGLVSWRGRPRRGQERPVDGLRERRRASRARSRG